MKVLESKEGKALNPELNQVIRVAGFFLSHFLSTKVKKYLAHLKPLMFKNNTH